MSEEQAPVWAVLDHYGYEPVEIIRETKKTVYYKCQNWGSDDWHERASRSAFPWRGDKEAALKLSAQLTSAENEKRQRTNAAIEAFRKKVQELTQ